MRLHRGTDRNPVAPQGRHDLLACAFCAPSGQMTVDQVVVVDAIPRLPSGKALRRDLGERFLQADR